MNQRLSHLLQLLELKTAITKNAYQHFLKAQEEFKKIKIEYAQLQHYHQDSLRQLKSIAKTKTDTIHLSEQIEFIIHLEHNLVELNRHVASSAKLRARADLHYKQAKKSEEEISCLITRLSLHDKGQQVKRKKDEYVYA